MAPSTEAGTSALLGPAGVLEYFPVAGNPAEEKKSPAASGATLVWPVLSTAAAPQLAVDLLAGSLLQPSSASSSPSSSAPSAASEQRQQPACALPVGVLESAAVLPLAAADPFLYAPGAGVATAMDVYASADGRVVAVQQRAPALPECHAELARAVVELARSWGCARVLMLCSSDSAWRTDAQMQGPQWRWETTTAASSSPSTSAAAAAAAATSAAAAEGKASAVLRSVSTGRDLCEEKHWPRLEAESRAHVLKPGSLLAHVWEELLASTTGNDAGTEKKEEGQQEDADSAADLEGVLVNLFCTEGGDPMHSAALLASLAADYTDLVEPGTSIQWKVPRSWEALSEPALTSRDPAGALF